MDTRASAFVVFVISVITACANTELNDELDSVNTTPTRWSSCSDKSQCVKVTDSYCKAKYLNKKLVPEYLALRNAKIKEFGELKFCSEGIDESDGLECFRGQCRIKVSIDRENIVVD